MSSSWKSSFAELLPYSYSNPHADLDCVSKSIKSSKLAKISEKDMNGAFRKEPFFSQFERKGKGISVISHSN